MMVLRDLFCRAYPDNPYFQTLPQTPIQGLECDSRKVEKDFLFIAITGSRLDASQFIQESIQKGAIAVAGEAESKYLGNVPYIQIPQGRAAVARLASVFYGQPSHAMKCVGITGTNGKTTSSFLLEHILKVAGKNVGVMGTINYRFGKNQIQASQTTPGPLTMQHTLAQMRDHGVEYVVMEVSSHALDQERVGGIDFETALMTNLTQDHLDYHKTMQEYFECKAKLFSNLTKEKTAVFNADDSWAQKFYQKTHAKILRYSLKDSSAEFFAKDVVSQNNQMGFSIHFKSKKFEVKLPLVGIHNVYNALGVLATSQALGIDMGLATSSLSTFKGVPGRLESIDGGQDFLVYVDFAHTPDGLLNVLQSLVPHKTGKLLLVFGCGGDRDKTKRPQMAAIASQFCDHVYVTSDNPRSEDPKKIAQDVCAGFSGDFKNFSVVCDRQKAIRQALLAARAGDIVLLAGKGHEQSQIIGNQVIPFSDQDEVRRVLRGN